MKLKRSNEYEPVPDNQRFGRGKEQIGRPLLMPIFFCLVSGVLLILLKNLALMITGFALAAGLIILGIWMLIEYIRSEPIVRIIEAKLAIGLILLVTGSMLAFSPESLGGLLPYAWGLALLFGVFLKIQYAFDRKSLGAEKWWILLILAAFSLIIGVILLSEAVLDITVFLLLKRKIRKRSEAPHKAEIQHEPKQDAAAPQAAEESLPETEA